jgi:hypothetical protein
MYTIIFVAIFDARHNQNLTGARFGTRRTVFAKTADGETSVVFRHQQDAITTALKPVPQRLQWPTAVIRPIRVHVTCGNNFHSN